MNRKRIVSCLLLTSLLLTLTPMAAFAADGPVLISNAEELASAIASNPAGSYKLAADITLEGEWLPLPVQTSAKGPFFTGTLDGDGHVIRGLKVALSETEGPTGLISEMGGGSIQNLGLELAPEGVSGGYWVGGLVGCMDAGTIENCYVKGTVSQTGSPSEDNLTAGGLVGYMLDGTVSRCYSEGAVSGAQQVGGLVGCMAGGVLTDCYSWSDVDGDDVVGGLVGQMDGGSLTRCYYAKGTVTGREGGGSIGTVVGWRTDAGDLEECYYVQMGAQDAIGEDDKPWLTTPEHTSDLTSGSPLSSAWDDTAWLFVQGQYPVFRQGEPPEVGTLDPPQGLTCSSQQLLPTTEWRYEVAFPAVRSATGYSLQLYGEDGRPVGEPVVSSNGATSGTVSIKLNEAIDAAALLELEKDPGKTTFQFTCGVKALGSGGLSSPESDPAALPELHLLESIANATLPGQRHPKGTSYLDKIRPMLPASAEAVADGQPAVLSLSWPLLNPIQKEQAIVEVEAAFLLPENVINPKRLGVSVRLVFYTQLQPPSTLSWDPLVPSKATWVNTDNAGSTSVQLLKDGEAVGDWKLIPRAVAQEYDFTQMIRAAGSGSYTFQAKANGSKDADQLYLGSGVAVAAAAYPYQYISTVTFDPQGGDPVPPRSGVAYGEAITPPVPMRTGYTFTGWFTQPAGTGAAFTKDTPVLDNLTVYAQWAANPYTVAFDANGGTGGMASLPCTYGQVAALPSNAFTRTGWNFAGWGTAPAGAVRYGDGQGVLNPPGAALGRVTLYAMWSQEPVYRISGTVKGSDGNPMEGVKVTLKQGVTEWPSTVTDGRGAYTIEGVPDGTFNLVAEYGSKTMTVLVIVSGADVDLKVITMPQADINSVVDVADTADTPHVVVGGLEQEAAQRAEPGKTVTISMMVAAQPRGTGDPAAKAQIRKIEALAQGQTLEFLNFTVLKQTLDGIQTKTETLDVLNTVLELVIPFDSSGKQAVTAYRCHKGIAEPLKGLGIRPDASSRQDGTFYRKDGMLYVYANRYSTYAIGYRAPAPTPPTSGGSGTASYTITATAGTGGSISPSGKVRVSRNSRKAFTINPADGYVVSDVLVDGKSVGAVDSYTFEKVAAAHTIRALFQEGGAGRLPWNPFGDVEESDWFYGSVQEAYEKGLMVGTSGHAFSPGMNTTRGMMFTILWRVAGEPEVDAAVPFTDVVHGAYYEKAVAWGTETGVVQGYGNGLYGPNDLITREQLAAILYRWAEWKGQDVSADAHRALSRFEDAAQISGWALPAMAWACDRGVLQGRGAGILDPAAHATRAEAAAMLQRFLHPA